jgi:hypothetical protein
MVGADLCVMLLHCVEFGFGICNDLTTLVLAD